MKASHAWPFFAGSSRPAPVQQAPLPPFDQNPDLPDQQYPGGNGVASTPPPEWTAQWPTTPDLLALRADFTGLTIPGNYTPTSIPDILANGGVTLVDGPYKGTFIPFLPGANATPPTMIMSAMLPLYPEAIQVIYFTEHCYRGYTHFIWDTVPWNGDPMTSAQAIAWDQKVRITWGQFSYIWRGVPILNDTVVQDVRAAGGCDICGVGEEVDSKFDAVTYEEVILPDYFKLGCPLAAHFTAQAYTPQYPDVGAWSYPLRFPRDTFLRNWSLYDGKLHLAQQVNQDAPAGLQSSLMYYARLHVNAGIGDAAQGPGAPNSRIWMFENQASNQLQGRSTEGYGCLRSLEACWAPNGGNPKVRSMGGYGNGGRKPDGTAL